MNLANEIKALEQAIKKANSFNNSISDKGVSWHIDHSLKVINGVCKTLIKSNPDDYKWKFNKVRLYIFTRGSIPRGKGKAPKRVTSEGEIQLQELHDQLETAKQIIQKIEALPKKSNFDHPYFGMLKRDKSLKFLIIHTNHHLNIIHDIIKSET